MAKITDLPSLDTPNGSEQLAVVSGDGKTSRTTIAKMASASGLSIPLVASAGGTVNAFVLTLPPQIVLVTGTQYRFAAPSDPTGDITINGYPLLYDNGAKVAIEAGITKNWQVAVRWDGAPANVFRFVACARDTRRLATAEAAIAKNATAIATKGAFCAATGGNAVTLVEPEGGFVAGALYRYLSPALTTGPLSINGVALLYDNGARVGGEIAVPAGWEMTVRYDGPPANVFRFVRSSFEGARLAALEASTSYDLLDGLKSALRDNPWGTIGAGNQVTPIEIPVVGCANSNGTSDPARNPGAPAGYGINDILVAKLNAATVRGGAQYISDNRGFGGEVFNQFAMRLGESGYYRDGLAKIVTIAGVTNDAEEGNYNSGQAFTGGRDALIELLKYNKSRGYLTLLFTMPHPYTGIKDYGAFFRNNPGVPQYYPRYVANNVDPNSGMYPPAWEADGTTPGSKKLLDMSGSGILSFADLRYRHVNQMVRDVARLFPQHCIVIDGEFSWFRNGVEVYGEAALFDQPSSGVNVVHFNALGHRVGLWRPMGEFVADWIAGRRLRRIYRGDREAANVDEWPILSAAAFSASGGQALSANAWSTVLLPTIELARGLAYDTATGLATVTTPGLYRLAATLGVQESTNAGPIAIGVGLVNQDDAHTVSSGKVSGSSTTLPNLAVTRTMRLTVGDQPRLFAFASQASNVRKASLTIERVK